MNVLKAAIRKVEQLRRDLSAEIVIQEEDGHFEDIDATPRNPDWGGYANCADMSYEPIYEKRWIVDKPAVKEPDTEKREAAKVELQQIYVLSKWFSVRYRTGKALDISDAELNDNMISWTKILGVDRDKPKARKDLRYMYKRLPNQDHRRMAGEALGYSNCRIRLHEFFYKITA